MNIDFSNGCLWHTDCEKNTHRSGVCKAIRHDEETKRSLIKCLHCGKQGYYSHGRVGLVCTEEVNLIQNNSER